MRMSIQHVLLGLRRVCVPILLQQFFSGRAKNGFALVLYISLHRHEGGKFYPGTGAAHEVITELPYVLVETLLIRCREGCLLTCQSYCLPVDVLTHLKPDEHGISESSAFPICS